MGNAEQRDRDTGDRWAAGSAYEAYMGRWSRLLAREFLDWLKPDRARHWLEVGCGTGALTSSIVARSEPASIVACDPSVSFVEHVKAKLPDPRVSSVVATADAPPSRAGGFDAIVSGLVLNFVPQPGAALAAMRERLRSGGVVAAYLWDYSGGVEFLAHFWEEATASDPDAAVLDESRRFAAWRPSHVTSLFDAAGLVAIESATLAVPTVFSTFDDYWRPFLGGAGPAPSYVASLPEPRRDALAKRLEARLPRSADGSIRLHARALAIRGRRP